MRIITGSAKGCKLKAPKGILTRPTADRVKESVFNILGSEILDVEVLDLFAGTGNLGLEALSRGAKHTVFVDQNPESVQIIRENSEHTRLAASEIIRSDVFSALQKFNRLNKRFQLVFCDPPYRKGLGQKVLFALDTLNILSDEAIIVIEHERKDDLDLSLQNIELKRSQKYGSTTVSFFLYTNANKVNAEIMEEK